MKEIRCTCGKLLGKISADATGYEFKCPRCKTLVKKNLTGR